MNRTSPLRYRAIGLGFFMVAILFAGLIAFLQQPIVVEAAKGAPETQPQGSQPTNDLCLGCHSRPDQTVKLASGEELNITVDPEAFSKGVHGDQGLSCTQCHNNITGYPHPEVTAKSLKEYTLQYQQTCKNCHGQEFQANMDSMHSQALINGNLNAPTCSSCHNPHTQTRVTDGNGKLLPEARVWVPEVCSRCHNAIFLEYKESVHGQGVLEGNNPDVPTCTDCHGVHNIANPTTTVFRVNSPKLCANCHTDAAIMDKYGLSTQVLNTYVSDFHGTTVTLFQKQHPDQETNKPVCFDCHGVHNIAKADDPQKGLKIKENMLVACQKCHPDANTNFPDSWLSHYIPSPEHAPLVYYVQLFYKIFIPLVLGGMALYVLSDIYRLLRTRGKSTSDHNGKSSAA
jgi:predicted CXXCH cytochrome family protein